jgi:hypothetical protein
MKRNRKGIERKRNRTEIEKTIKREMQ